MSIIPCPYPPFPLTCLVRSESSLHQLSHLPPLPSHPALHSFVFPPRPPSLVATHSLTHSLTHSTLPALRLCVQAKGNKGSKVPAGGKQQRQGKAVNPGQEAEEEG